MGDRCYQRKIKMRIDKFISSALIFLILISPGCSTLRIHQFAVKAERPLEYVRFFDELDKAVEKAGVKNASQFSIPGFPYLRADRFLIGLRQKIIDDSQKEFWVQWMRQEALESREKEIRNLSDSAVVILAHQLGIVPDREMILNKLSFYSEQLFQHDKNISNFYDILKLAVNDPGEYSTLQRFLGLYPLFSLPVIYGTNKTYNQFRKWYKRPFEERGINGSIKVYAPAKNLNFSRDIVDRVFNSSPRNVLGVPQLTQDEIDELILILAPVFYQDQSTDYDRFGEVEWEKNRVTINHLKPTVYYYVSYAFIKGEPVLQINYVIWYAARSAPGAPWIERGPLDGLTVRVTLDPNGWPMMVDIMNNCGCYHFFVPRKEKVATTISQPWRINPFVPTWLPESFPQKHFYLRINSGWHQVERIHSGEIPANVLSYELLPYDILEILPHIDGHTESVFTSQGIMKNSKRMEPIIFFSMGVPDIGYMRQRGHHAIKLVGRSYFDDPQLFEQNFIFK